MSHEEECGDVLVNIGDDVEEVLGCGAIKGVRVVDILLWERTVFEGNLCCLAGAYGGATEG